MHEKYTKNIKESLWGTIACMLINTLNITIKRSMNDYDWIAHTTDKEFYAVEESREKAIFKVVKLVLDNTNTCYRNLKIHRLKR